MQNAGNTTSDTVDRPQGSHSGKGVSAIGNPGGSIQQAMAPARDKLSSAATAIQEKSIQVIDGAKRYVQGYPLRSVLFAAAVGLVVRILIGDRGIAEWRHRPFWNR